MDRGVCRTTVHWVIRVRHNWACIHAHTHTHIHTHTHCGWRAGSPHSLVPLSIRLRRMICSQQLPCFGLVNSSTCSPPGRQSWDVRSQPEFLSLQANGPTKRRAFTAFPDTRASEGPGGTAAGSQVAETGAQRRTATASHRLWHRFRVTLDKPAYPFVVQPLMCKTPVILLPCLAFRKSNKITSMKILRKMFTHKIGEF